MTTTMEVVATGLLDAAGGGGVSNPSWLREPMQTCGRMMHTKTPRIVRVP